MSEGLVRNMGSYVKVFNDTANPETPPVTNVHFLGYKSTRHDTPGFCGRPKIFPSSRVQMESEEPKGWVWGERSAFWRIEHDTAHWPTTGAVASYQETFGIKTNEYPV